MSKLIDMNLVTPTERMSGEDEEDTELLRVQLAEARRFLLGHDWCRGIEREFFGGGVGGVAAVFLFEILAVAGVDRFLWVVSGDLPCAYLVTDEAPTPRAALEGYCALMDAWIQAVRNEGGSKEVFPVAVVASAENADRLEKRVRMLRGEISSAFPG